MQQALLCAQRDPINRFSQFSLETEKPAISRPKMRERMANGPMSSNASPPAKQSLSREEL
jgi:hypothetical protein